MTGRINLTIQGKCGSGKTTILALVETALEDAGLSVVIDSADVADLRFARSDLAAPFVARKSEVVLRTVTSQRSPRGR